jgi:catechol 2,3-dioxygenase-like lactoylglutathione lyase family enzyme
MIDHLKIEVSDFDASKAFYKAALTALGFRAREFASGPARHPMRRVGSSWDFHRSLFTRELPRSPRSGGMADRIIA